MRQNLERQAEEEELGRQSWAAQHPEETEKTPTVTDDYANRELVATPSAPDDPYPSGIQSYDSDSGSGW